MYLVYTFRCLDSPLYKAHFIAVDVKEKVGEVISDLCSC